MRSALIALAVAALAASSGQAAAPKPAPAAPPAAQDMAMGNPKAKVVIDEYASLSCTHCAHFNNEIFPGFKAKYVDTGKVRYVLHEYLTPPENIAAAGFLVARCAGPASYFKVVDAFFRSQAEMYEKEDLRTPLLAAGKLGGLDEDAVKACLANQDQIQALETRVQTSIDKGVNATPTFYVNGVKAQEGVMTLDQLDTAIAQAGKPGKKK
ncbi:DsbA family protein [Phenylobacterium aquaticum]|uniref:DsbA family protein n=1 Tax=Phenylobacterium aquaticum TaxID=1763816 RepID=UPI0026EEF874|nr:DsbA family protein [Phenylobacterium aquaticum]